MMNLGLQLGKVWNMCIFYGHVVTIGFGIYLGLEESSIARMLIWMTWGILYVPTFRFIARDVVWIAYSWFVIKTHFDLEVIQLIHEFESKIDDDAIGKANSIIRTFVDIERKLHQFQHFSIDILAAVIFVSVSSNGLMIFMGLTVDNQFIALGMLLVAIVCISVFLILIFSATSLSRLSVKLNRILLSFFGRNHNNLTVKQKIALLSISKSLHGKNNIMSFKTFGLKFECNFITRYIFYSFKISWFVVNLIHNIEGQ
jgi:hypothetical protein